MREVKFKIGDYVYYRNNFLIVYNITDSVFPIKTITKQGVVMHFEKDGTHSITVKDKLQKITREQYISNIIQNTNG